MKRILILIFLACGCGVMPGAAARAQSPALVSSTDSMTGTSESGTPPEAGRKHGGGQGRGHGGILARLTSELSLSGSQEAAIAPILEAARPQMKAIEENAAAQRKALIASVSAQITPLLTPDQQTKFADMVQKVEAGPGRAGGGGGRALKRGGAGAEAADGPGGQRDLLKRLTTQLNLTPDQQNQIKPILDAAHAQVVATRQDTTLTVEQKFAKIKETMEAARSQLKGILTPAQQEQLATLRDQYPRLKKRAAVPAASPAATGTN